MHTVKQKKQLLQRVRRLRGQVEGIERALLEEKGCYEVLHVASACRGALNSLMFEILQGHVLEHLVTPGADPESDQVKAAAELLETLRSYVK